jgi:hypothetical protein
VFDIGQMEMIEPVQRDPCTITAQLTGTDEHGIVDALSTYLPAAAVVAGSHVTCGKRRRALPGSGTRRS